MGPFEKALQKVQHQQMTHEDRSPGDRRVRDALKTMGDLAYDTTSLPFQMLTYSPEAEAAFNPKFISEKIISSFKDGPGFKSRTLPTELNIDHFLRMARGIAGEEAPEITAKRVAELVEKLRNEKLQSPLQLWMQGNKVTGHEGRHRAMALRELGEKTAPVNLTHDRIRWSEQLNPDSFDYLPTEDIPNSLIGEDGKMLFTDLLRNSAGRNQKELKTLFHGGRPFTKWDPGTIGFGEGRFLAQGPGLYAGDIEDLARIYKKYGGDDPALLKLAVDDSRIFNPALKMSPEHKEAYDRAASILDPRGYGLRGKLMDVPRYKYDQTRKLLVDSGIDGMRQRLGDELGDEWVIFNPDIIKSVDRIE